MANKMPAARKRQLIVMGGVALTLTAIALMAAFFVEKNKKAQEAVNAPMKQEVENTTVLTDTTESMMGNVNKNANTIMAAKISELEKRDKEKEENLKRLLMQLEGGKDQLPSGFTGSLPPAPPMPSELKSDPALNSNLGARPNLEQISSIETVTIGQRQQIEAPAIAQGGIQVVNQNERTSDVTIDPNFKRSTEVANVRGVRSNINVVEDGGDVTYASYRRRESYIPSGTIFQAVLLGGLDAPTNTDAQSASPHPVLLRVEGMAILPNKKKFNLKGCFITGNGYGDISSERAYIRTERISCVNQDGTAIDAAIKGYIAGEDGKTGIRGNIVTKQGAILANAMKAGVLSGLGSGIAASFDTVSDTALGTTRSTKPGDEYKKGVASGFGDAMDRIAGYYLKLADKTFPVIEINAGRKVDIVLLSGMQLGEHSSEEKK